MAFVHIKKDWAIAEQFATPEQVYLNRRNFMKAMGFIGAGALIGATSGCEAADDFVLEIPHSMPGLYPARRNESYTVDRALTPEKIAAQYNNFYEFTTDKARVHTLTGKFEINPWQIEIAGEVEKPGLYDLDDLLKKMTLEERVYRFRCVEAWAMTVPWTGFPLKALIDRLQPTSNAKYVRMFTFNKPDQAPGIKSQSWYPWPYFEGLTMAEATHELTLLATGIYGHALPKQHGAPIRLVTPWKYGYKSIKSIVKIEFTRRKPPTFWNDLAPDEYDFYANVNPNIPHPRWSQASERLISTGERVETRMHNGYGDFVAKMYG
ncbi:MAG: protein-methionine-sulfoxide reductase catalytic subunit MsrP [bacterium]|nr:protein-methionine-sulfoxide reductase catalytic subunit MsrP [bacterium]